MNFWPPKPGLTVITNIVSTLSSTSLSIPTGVAGLMTAPASAPSSRIIASARSRCAVASWRTRADEFLNIEFGLLDHQMHIQGQAGCLAQRGHYRNSQRKVGDEVAVHDVHMNNVRAGFFDATNFVAEFGEVRG